MNLSFIYFESILFAIHVTTKHVCWKFIYARYNRYCYRRRNILNRLALEQYEIPVFFNCNDCTILSVIKLLCDPESNIAQHRINLFNLSSAYITAVDNIVHIQAVSRCVPLVRFSGRSPLSIFVASSTYVDDHWG